MASIAQIIRKHHREIVQCWMEEAGKAASARGLPHPEFRNILPSYLSSLAEEGAADELSRRRRELVEGHLGTRLRQGFHIAEIVEEFALLGHCISRRWLAYPQDEQPSAADIEHLYWELSLASKAAVETFNLHMLEDEQTEKRYRRLLQKIAMASVEKGAPPLRERLKEVLELIMEATDSQNATLLLFDSTGRHLIDAASVGVASEHVKGDVSSLAPSSLTGWVASREESTSIGDIATTELEVNDVLRQSGLHALLGVRIPQHYELIGVLYIGLLQKRPFAAREVRRLESLGEQLTLHVIKARLFAERLATIEELRSERDLRERFVSVLAHDLRGPLSAAKLGVQLLATNPAGLDHRRELIARTARSIDRTDQMVRDLLDASRLHAGESLPLRLEDTDLAAIARDVIDELVALHADRFVLDAPEQVRGFWSPDDLRRALWNLASNAVKYGAPDRPITLAVRRSTRGGGQLSVHNEGNAISQEDQAHLFQPFFRSDAVRVTGPRGWGLGLTLVQGCAEAHGGSVKVDSHAATGTTFTLELPVDSRPYQRPAGKRPPES